MWTLVYIEIFIKQKLKLNNKQMKFFADTHIEISLKINWTKHRASSTINFGENSGRLSRYGNHTNHSNRGEMLICGSSLKFKFPLTCLASEHTVHWTLTLKNTQERNYCGVNESGEFSMRFTSTSAAFKDKVMNIFNYLGVMWYVKFKCQRG